MIRVRELSKRHGEREVLRGVSAEVDKGETPAISTWPASKSSRKFRQRSSVDLPPPDGPTIAIVSPRWTSADTSRNTSRVP